MNFKETYDSEKKILDIYKILFISEIKKYKEDYESETENLLELYRNEYNKEEHPEAIFEIPVVENMIKYKIQYLNALSRYKNNPYFGKIIYEDEKGILNEIYIGKIGVLPLDDNIKPIIDWRAPISSVYYDCNIGNTSFYIEDTKKTIDLKLKRTIKIVKGEIKKIYDSDTVLGDDMLIECLAQNKKTVLNEIISTIQSEQNYFIRKPLSVNLIVQGLAGSGKTTVAMHRISYLIYKYKDTLKEENILLIEKDILLLNYISSMLPELDIDNIKQQTLNELIINTYEYILDEKLVIDNKDDIDFYEELEFQREDIIETLTNKIFNSKDLIIDGHTILYKFQIDTIKKKNISLREKAKYLDKIIAEKINELKYEVKKCDYSKFSNFYDFYFKQIKNIDFAKIVNIFKHGEMSINKAATILILYFQIYGDKIDDSIKHIVIDEAQDLSEIVFHCIKLLCPSATFTIVGDINQKVVETGLSKWSNLKNILGNKIEYMELERAYRNSYEITVFAKKCIEQLCNKKINCQPLKRYGNKVQIFNYRSNDDIIDKIKYILNMLTKNLDFSTAIIFNDIQYMEMVLKKLNSEYKITHLRDLTANDKSIIFTTANESKGFEFDSVIIPDFDNYDLKGNKLYIAITRALHNLFVISNRKELESINTCIINS